MIDFLKQELPAHYGLHRSVVEVPAECTDELCFDLADGHDTMIVAYGSGNVSFDRSCQTTVQVIDYECYLNGLAGTGFERGRLRCDFIVYDAEKNGFFILNEQTSATGGIRNLQKPILDKKTGNVKFPGGKYEKVEAQLIETLRTLKAVPGIDTFMGKFARKVCLMSYILTCREEKDEVSEARRTFTVRYRQVEARETGEDGALLVCPGLNAEGFEYRRISHEYSFCPEK